MNKNETSIMDGRLVEILGADVMGITDSGLENATIKMSHINRLWKEGIYGDCKIGVVDTGLSQIDHPMIKDKVITGRNFTNDNRGIDNLYSSHFHGLAVCSLIVGNYMNKICFGGSPNCKIVLAKVMEDNGSGDLSNIAQGINYCVSEGCSIINLSVGSTYDSDELKQAVKNAADKNISIVCASGNDNNPELDKNGYSIDEKRFPGFYP